MWGQTSSNPSRRTSIPPNGILSTPRPTYSTPPTRRSSFHHDQGIQYSTTDSKEIMKEEEVEVVYDPEAATSGPTHRPSKCSRHCQSSSSIPWLISIVILTHSFMVGLGLLALTTIQMGGVAQVCSYYDIVSSNPPPLLSALIVQNL